MRKGSNANEAAQKLSIKEINRGSRKSQVSESHNVEVVAEHPSEYVSDATLMVGGLKQVNEAQEESKAFNTQSSGKPVAEINQHESFTAEVAVQDDAQDDEIKDEVQAEVQAEVQQEPGEW